jgi:CheY-like chemotaxis protein
MHQPLALGARAAERGATMTKVRMLLVEDNGLVLGALADELGERFDLVEADTGELALAILDRPGRFDVVISDYDLGCDVSGAEVLDRARRNGCASLCVLLVGAVRPELPPIHSEMADIFMKKPVTARAVTDMLRRYGAPRVDAPRRLALI